MKKVVSILLVFALVNCMIIVVCADTGSVDFNSINYMQLSSTSELTLTGSATSKISMNKVSETSTTPNDLSIDTTSLISTCNTSVSNNTKYDLVNSGWDSVDYRGKFKDLKYGSLTVVIPCSFNYNLILSHDNKDVSLGRKNLDSYSMSLFYNIGNEFRNIYADNISYFSGYGLLANFVLNESDVYNIKTLNTDIIFRVSKNTDINFTGTIPNNINGDVTFNLYLNSFCYKTAYYTQDDDATNNIINIISQINDKLGTLNNTADDMSTGIARLVAVVDALNSKLDLSTSTLNAIVENQKQTNDYLNNKLQDDIQSSVSSSLEQAAEDEKNEAMAAGDQAISDAHAAIDDSLPVQQFSESVNNFAHSMSTNSTVSVWEFPALYIPALPVLGNQPINLSEKVDINLSQAYLINIPEELRNLIGATLGVGLVIYLIKESMSLITYIMDGRSKDVDGVD